MDERLRSEGSGEREVGGAGPRNQRIPEFFNAAFPRAEPVPGIGATDGPQMAGGHEDSLMDLPPGESSPIDV